MPDPDKNDMIPQRDDVDNYRKRSFERFQQLEKWIAHHLELPELRSGNITIRNEKGWRENEKFIAYAWVVEMDRFSVGSGGVFAVKFNETPFRDQCNKEELVQGVFRSSDSGIQHFYKDSLSDTSLDIADLFNLNLLDANKGITLDGVSYKLGIDAMNIRTFIEVGNPNTDAWQKWETKIWEMGSRLAKASDNLELISLFE